MTANELGKQLRAENEAYSDSRRELRKQHQSMFQLIELFKNEGCSPDEAARIAAQMLYGIGASK